MFIRFHSYPLVMTNQHSHGKWPIEIDGLPIKNGGYFHGYVSLPEGICYRSGSGRMGLSTSAEFAIHSEALVDLVDLSQGVAGDPATKMVD
jgi:hypothetical protein